MSYFPRPESISQKYEAERRVAAGDEERLAEIDHRQGSEYLEQSLLGRLGKTVEPLFVPLGWDWKVSSAVIAAFPAREVVIAVLGTIYAVGADVGEDDEGLIDQIKSAEHPADRGGGLVFSLPVALGLMVFFAFCLQCGATVAAIRRETNTWSWPVFAWVYMTVLAYAGAFVTVRVAEAILGA